MSGPALVAEPERWVVPVEDAGARLDTYVAGRAGDLSRNQVRAALESGRLTVNDAVPNKAGVSVRGGDVIALVRLADRSDAPPEPQDIPLTVVYEDDAVAVVDKPAGMVVHPAPGHRDGTLVNALMYHLGDLGGGAGRDRPGIVHRIDKDTSGLLVIAKTDAAMASLQAQFAARTPYRRYRAVAFGPRMDDAGTIDTDYGRHHRDRKRFTSLGGSRRATTHWRVLARGEALILLELRLQTGRTHQIRVHLAETGHPVVADPIYGRKAPKGGTGRTALELAAARRMPRVALHAAELGFTHPDTGEELRFASPDPDDFAALVAAVTDTPTG